MLFEALVQLVQLAPSVALVLDRGYPTSWLVAPWLGQTSSLLAYFGPPGQPPLLLRRFGTLHTDFGTASRGLHMACKTNAEEQLGDGLDCR